MAQIEIGLGMLMETKIVGEWYPKPPRGTLSCARRWQAVTREGMWKEDDQKFEVKTMLFNNCPNILTFKLVKGDKQFYVIGVYIPPNGTRGWKI
jgi:hypothetical protein